MKIGHITQDRVECYETDIDNFDADIEAFYCSGITSFMINKHVGGKESYHFHCICFYTLILARHIWRIPQVWDWMLYDARI